MKYITEKGTEIGYHEPSLARRTLSFRMNSPRTFDANKMIRIVDQEGEGLVKEIRFLNKFRHPDKGISHAYDVVFQIPYCMVAESRMKLNRIMVRIEDRMEVECDVKYGTEGQGRHRREWMAEEI